MANNEWCRFISEGWKFHLVPSELLGGLLEDSIARKHEVMESGTVTEGFIDLPGMILMNRTEQTFTIGDFKLSMPTEDMEHFYNSLKNSPVRTFSNGKKYHKIHGWLTCVVFTPEQRTSVLIDMEQRMPAAKIEAKKENARFQEAIASINKGGTKVITSKAPSSIPKRPKSKKKDEKN